MGTRALISINKKSFIATHWDGYPSDLGKDLLESDKSIDSIIEITNSHSIDFADKTILEKVNNLRLKELCKKHNLTIEEVKKGKRKGDIICSDDYEVLDIEHYGDWSEYEYNIENNEVYVRKLCGAYPESLEGASDYILLTDEIINDSDILSDNDEYKKYREKQLDMVNKRIEKYRKESDVKSANI